MAPSSTITLSQVNLAVEYQDNHIKRQAWGNTFIDLTERLVFIAEFVEPAERQRFLKSHRDWRDNPCLVRYRTDGRDPDFFVNAAQMAGSSESRRKEDILWVSNFSWPMDIRTTTIMTPTGSARLALSFFNGIVSRLTLQAS
jgi:hypothetical protein